MCFLLGVLTGMVIDPLHLREGDAPRALTAVTSRPEKSKAALDEVPQEAEAQEDAPSLTPSPPTLTEDESRITCFRGNPARNLSGVGPVPRRPKVLWRFRTQTKLEGPYEQRGDPSLTSGTAWQGLGWTGQPCILDGRVYFGSTDSYVYCLDLETGAEIWHYGTHHNVKGSISLWDGAIYHGGRDNKVRRYDLEGQMVWETRIGQDTDSNPILVNGTLYIGGEDNTVYAFDPETGEVRWKFGPTQGSCESSPCLAEDALVIGSSAGGLYCLRPDTGELIWSVQTGGDGDPTPVYMRGRIFHAIEIGNGARGQVHCVRLGTGEVLWRRELPQGVWATVAVNPDLDRVYVGCNDGRVYCLSAETGDLLWDRLLTGARIWSSPVLTDGTLLVGVRDGTLWCLDEATGAPLWVFDERGDIDATPAVAAGRIVIGSQDGWVYCIGEAPPDEPLDPHWFRTGPDFKTPTDAQPVSTPTITSAAPQPQAYPDTHAGFTEGLWQPVRGPGFRTGSR